MPAVTSSHEETNYRVDDLIMDVARGCVSRGGHVISLSPLSFELLLALVRAAPNVLPMDDIMNQVWPGIVVSPETVSQRVKLVRDALGDRAVSPRYISGVRGRGYRIVCYPRCGNCYHNLTRSRCHEVAWPTDWRSDVMCVAFCRSNVVGIRFKQKPCALLRHNRGCHLTTVRSRAAICESFPR